MTSEMSALCEKIENDCRSIRKSIFVIYVELAIILISVIIFLGIQVGKFLGR